jgi:hypothetical protein
MEGEKMMNLGVDIGYRAVKAKGDHDKVLFPSVVGSPIPASRLEVRGQSLRAFKTNDASTDYLPVGQAALTHSAYATGRRDPGWVLEEAWELLFVAAVSEFVRTPMGHVNVVLGLPVDDYNVYASKLREGIEGKSFYYQRWGRDSVQSFIAHDVLVIPQAYGSLLSLALTSDNLISDNVWSNGMVGVCDLGGNTMNLIATHRMDEISRWTVGDEFGLLHALDRVTRDIRDAFPHFNPSTQEVAGWLAEGNFPYQGEQHDIGKFATAHLEPLVSMVINRMASAWPEAGRFDAVLLTGGGASAIGKYIRHRMIKESGFGRVELHPSPQWGNVDGYLKLANRIWGA